MSIRHGLLALLTEQPRYGYQLRLEFERRTGATWPLNVGQVYTTLARLERDGLVESAGRGEDGTSLYRLTDLGRDEVARWWSTPVVRTAPARDELAIKLALAVTVPGVAVASVLQRQRTETLQALQQYTRLKAQADDSADLAWLLVLDNLVFAAEAEVRWLDHVESRLARAAATRPGRTPASAGPMSGPVGAGPDSEPGRRTRGSPSAAAGDAGPAVEVNR